MNRFQMDLFTECAAILAFVMLLAGSFPGHWERRNLSGMDLTLTSRRPNAARPPTVFSPVE